MTYKDFYSMFGSNANEQKQEQTPQKKFWFYYAWEMIVAGLQAKCNNQAVWNKEYDKIVEWLRYEPEGKRKGLLVIGDVGQGKSLICRDIIPTILNKDCYNGAGITYFPCIVRSAYRMKERFEDIFESYYRYIMIDDIGTEGDFNDYGTKRNLFAEVVDHAEAQNKTLILTSNLTLKELEDRYGKRTMSRLSALCKLIQLEGKDLRDKSNRGNGIPEKIRAYGIDFKTTEEMDLFCKDQEDIQNKIYNQKVELYNKDRKAFDEGQPMKIAYDPYQGKNFAYALFAHDWDKYKELMKKFECV